MAWYNASWPKRKKITIPAAKMPYQSGAAAMPIVLASDADIAAAAKADGTDIVFTSGDEITKLKHEIVSYDSGTGALIAWVGVPTDPNNDVDLYLYYGNSGAADQQQADLMWNNAFTLHMEADPSGGAVAPQNSTTQQFSTDSTTHNVDIPAGWDIQSGDKLLILWGGNGTSTVTNPSGWNALVNENVQGSNKRFLATEITAAGTEAGTQVNVETALSSAGCAQVLHYRSCNSIEISTTADSNLNQDTAPDPPSFSPSWGQKLTRWLAVGFAYDDDEAFTGGPTNYSGLLSVVSGAGTNAGVSIGTASLELDAASDDPDAFTLDATAFWGAWVIALEPAAATIPDSSGNDVDFAAEGTWASGDSVTAQIGDGLSFSGSNRIETADSANADLGSGDWSLVGWVKPANLPADGQTTNDQTLLSKTVDANNRVYVMWRNVDHVQVVVVDGGVTSTWDFETFPTAWQNDVLQFVAIRYDASTGEMKVRRNDDADVSSTQTHRDATTAAPLQIGIRDAANDGWEGDLDEIRLFHEYLNDGFVALNYSIESDPTGAITVGSEVGDVSIDAVNSGSAITPGDTVTATLSGWSSAPDTVKLNDGDDPPGVEVAQTVSGTPTTTSIDFTVVLKDGTDKGVKYGSVVVEISNSTTGEVATAVVTLNPTGTNVYVDVANYPPPTGQLSVFDGASPGVQAGDQAELTTPSGSTSFTANPDGTLQIEPDGSYTLQARAWDSTDSTWGAWETTEINVAAGASDLEKWSLLESNRIPLPDGTDGIDLQEKYVFLGAYAFSDAGDVAAPTLQAATIVSSTLRLTLSEAVQFGAGGSGGVSLSLSGGAATATYLTGEGTSTLTYSLSRSVAGSETGTLDYTQPGDGIEDLAGNDLASVSAETVAISAAGGAIFSIVIRRRRR